jgi:hypothetical protein
MHRWFAWFPVVVVVEGERPPIWLRYIERRLGTSRVTGEKNAIVTAALTIIEHCRARLALCRLASNHLRGMRLTRERVPYPRCSRYGALLSRHNRKDRTMKRTAIALALLGASTLGFTQTSHAMSLPGQSALKVAAPSHTTDVYWRRGGGWWGPGLGVGIGFGIAAGALTAAALGPWGGGGYWGGYPGYAYGPAHDYGYAAPGYDSGYGYAPAYSDAYGPTTGYAPAYSYSYGPSYSYGTTYVRPRARYAYGRVGPGVRYANTWGSGVRSTYSSGPRYRAAGSRSAVRVANRRR